ncbi:unnamed protein product [Cuscuta epithymum]|uniref:Uncharacterized protein n=2 Tax=Cuscuta epithymum TaxID=186058 RepID=A0AAV0DEI2_9ASTE|nr:unnamed protein product [Cuscuta epithymum]
MSDPKKGEAKDTAAAAASKGDGKDTTANKGPAKKEEDKNVQIPKDQLQGISYCIISHPPWPETILLGFQHYLVMLGTAVIIPSALVPQMGGGNEERIRVIQTSLFVTGINTLLQSLFGTRLPAVMGGSYTFVVPTLSIIFSGRWNDPDPISKFKKIMRATQGAYMISSTLQIVLGFSSLWRSITSHLSPLSAVPLVCLAGFGLYEHGFPAVAGCIEIGLPQLLIVVFIYLYLGRLLNGGKDGCVRLAVVISVTIVWLYAYILTVSGAYSHRSLKTQNSCQTNRSGLVHAAPWIKIPYPFQWGAPSFDAGDSFAMLMATFVALVESTGGFIIVARFASATPVPPYVLSRGAGWQGIGIFLCGIFGTGVGSSVSIESAGLLAATRIGSRKVVQVSAGFMIFFSIFGKFGAVLASIPIPIVGALYCLLFAHVGGGGLTLLQFCNLNTYRTKFILGFSIFLGLSIPQYFNQYAAINGYGPVHTSGRWFNDIVNVPFSSKAFVAGVAAYFLDNTTRTKSEAKDSGVEWWANFKSPKSDKRNAEFYKLAFDLDKHSY